MSNNTNRTLMTEAQVDKYANVNTQIGIIDAAITEVLDLDFSTGNVTLTTTQFAENICFVSGADLNVPRTLNTPTTDNKKLFIVDNTLGTATLTVTNGTTNVAISAGGNSLFYTDGSANGLLQVAGGAAGSPTTLDWKGSVRAATTTNGTLATAYENGDSIDGVTLATGDRILLKDQTTASENGIYVVQATGAPVRAEDADESDELNGGATVYVKEGTVNAKLFYTLTTTGTIVVDTTNLTFELHGEAPGIYDIGGSYGGAIATTTSVLHFLAPRPFRIPSSASGSVGYVGTTDTTQRDFDMQKNGVSFGTMRFAISTATATFVSVTETDFASGDRFELVSPAAVGTLADLTFTFAGFRIGGS